MKKRIALAMLALVACAEAADPTPSAPVDSTSSALTIDDAGIAFGTEDPLSQPNGIFSLSAPSEMRGIISFGPNVATEGAMRFSQSPNAASILISTRSLNAGNPSTNVLTTLSTPWVPGNPDAGYNETVELGDARTTNAILVATNILNVMQPGGGYIWQWNHLGQVARFDALGGPGNVTALWTFGSGALAGNLGTLRWTGGGQHLFELRPTIGDGETSLLLRRNVGGAYSLERVSMGDADSCGTGFRCLRVAN